MIDRHEKNAQTFFGGRQPFTGHVARWFVKRTIRSHALWIAALYVEVEARSNMEAMIGRFDTVSVEFQQVKFKQIQVRGERSKIFKHEKISKKT